MEKIRNADLNSRTSDQLKYSNCPKMIVCQCPNSPQLTFLNKSVDQCRKIDLNYTVLKLQELVNDSSGCNDHSRICSLLYDFLHETGERGYYMKHLTAVLDILEFLSWKARDIKHYQVHLDRMLELCSQPLLLEKTSESLSCIVVVEQYFNVLGYLLVILPTKAEILKVYRALGRLLIQSTPAEKGSTVALEICHRAMETSQLPVILVKLLQVSPPDMYKRVLDLVFILVSVSSLCCARFLQVGILEHLLIRLHPSGVTEFSSDISLEISNLNLDKEDYYDEMILTTNIMWGLVKAAALPLGEKIPNVEKFPRPSPSAMWNLRCAFRREIFRSQQSSKSLMMRNDLATLILAGIVALPFWKLIRSGLVDDIALLLVAAELGLENTWVSSVKLSTSNQDLLFKKTLLLLVSHLAQSEAAVIIMKNGLVMPAVLQLINPEVHNYNISWSTSQYWYLAKYAMSTLTFLVPKMQTEFVNQQGPLRLIMMLEWCTTVEFDVNIVMNLVKTICSIITLNNTLILEDFCEQGVVISLTKLVHHILNCESLTMQHQRLLTLLLISTQEVMSNKLYLQKMYGDQSIKLVLRLLQRCLHQKKGEFQLDQRFLISIGSYIWECIVRCPMNVENFVERGAIYLMLDIIEDASFHVQCVYLGALSDMCQIAFCGPHLCTWRGVNKSKGLMSLLAETWREEEITKRVKRNSDGCVEDLELPLMGEEQWYTTYHSSLSHDQSPTLVDMIGSVRPKIYSIQKMMEDEADKYEKTREHYKILMDDIPTEDLVTMCIIDQYYQLIKGQVWIEVSRFLEQNGVNPLGMDGEVIHLMIQQHRRWAMCIKEKQEKILKKRHQKEAVKENEKFARIKSSKLASALAALGEIDYIRKTTDKTYKNEQEHQRTRLLEKRLNFSPEADEKNCHPTKYNFMNIVRQSYAIHDPEMQNDNFDDFKLIPVSPTNSEQSFNSSVSLMNKTSDSKLCFKGGYE